MDSGRTKYTAQWFYSRIFGDEPIKPRAAAPAEKIPSQLRAARSLENGPGQPWQSRESVFLKQGKLLAAYEDDFEYEWDPQAVRYFPTYESLSDRELRGYFSWRTKLRRGDVRKGPLFFAFVYIYELINQIGVADPQEGYCLLKSFRDTYGALDGRVIPYLDRWLIDYVVYYCLDPVLLSDSSQAVFDRSLSVFAQMGDHSDQQVMQAVKALCPKWLERSRFYGDYREDMDTVIVRVLRKAADHYAARCKRPIAEQFFGAPVLLQYRPFESAVFADRLKKRSLEYAVDPLCIYRCKGGLWTVQKYFLASRPNSKLPALIKTVDAVMRQEYRYKHPVKCEVETKWLLKLIREEILALLAEKKAAAAKKITIDYSQLEKIRQNAAITQEKLTVEEEQEDAPEETGPIAETVTPLPDDCPLDEPQYRLLQCLLYGRDWAWVREEGYMLSVLLDGINENLYEAFQDSVVDDTPAVIEDYIEDLMEMIQP